jgi:flagellar basal-body rod modification protein FlgD
MDITPTTAAGAAAASKTSDTEKATSAITGDFETFLTLLTTQMRNQDPLKPMDSTEFVAQLASFSQVEQQIRANERLESILGVLAGGGAGGLAEWIGKEVEVVAKADFAGSPVEVGISPMADADQAVLVVRNDFDQVVARLPVAAEEGRVSWDGKDEMGVTQAEGRYGFSLESYREGALLGTTEGRVFAAVSEVRLAEDGPVLVTADGTQVPLAEVAAVR